MLQFSASVEGETRRATVEPVDVEGIRHVSLRGFVRQLGGACAVSPASVRVDLANRSARVGINDTAVEASLKRFSLERPLLRQADDVLIAMTDLVPFFEKAFNVGVRQEEAREAPAAGRRVHREDLGDPDPFGALAEPDEMLSVPADRLKSEWAIRSVIIDPGHGGSDTGCRGRSLAEKDLTLALAQRFKELAEEEAGLTVILTREGDRDKPTVSRVNLAKLRRADLFISLHAGAGLSSAAHGFELFCQPLQASGYRGAAGNRGAASRHVGSLVAEGLAQATSAENRGIHAVDCNVLKELPMPGVLVEVGCLTNASEEELLQTEAYQARLAEGILAGLRPFLVEGNAGGENP
jgi:N-acetylmuramoyl-L-alanine amidase